MKTKQNTNSILMKNIFLLMLLFTGMVNAQIVTIPDANFKAKLLSSSTFNNIAYGNGSYIKIDQNNDGEIQEAEAIVIDSLNVPFSSIIDFSGISSFPNLKKIDCSDNQINNLNVNSLSLLQELYCSNNCMGTLGVNGLSNLKLLDANAICVSNFNLTGLTSLEYLSCMSNGLSFLDVSALVSLKSLNCSNNNISNLTISGLNSLETIHCENNLLMTSFNISSLPSLYNLYVSATNIGSLDLTSFTSLAIADCGNANLNTLLVSNLPNLYYLGCGENLLENLNLGSMPALEILNIGGNLFTTIDLSGTPNINRLECSSSLISNINLSNLSNLDTFVSYDGQFEELDFSLNPNLSILVLNSNFMLKKLFLKNGTIQNFNGNGLFECLNLEYICADDNEISQMLNFINESNLTNISINSYCSFTPGGNYNTITGTVHYDANNNGCDETDFRVPHFRFMIDLNAMATNASVYTGTSGNYNLYTANEGVYSLIPNIENASFFQVNPEPGIAILDVIDNSSTNLDFCITPNGVHPDVEVVISPIFFARPGFDATYQITYRNKGNQTFSEGLVSMQYNDAVLDFVSASQATFSQAVGNINWQYTNLLPFESRTITVTLNVNSPTETPAVNIGDLLNFVVSTFPLEADENPLDNTFEYVQTVVGSYDPNDITCLEGDVVAPSEIGNYLHYAINFENTGTFPAENVVVKTEVDAAKFDIGSLQLMNTNFPVDARISGNKVEFIFKNIQLPIGGHGHILLKIKTNETLVVGDAVANRADIFFDYNFPIDTGLANTVFQNLSNADFEIDNSVVVSPNPAVHEVIVKADNNIKSIQLYDVQGRIIATSLVDAFESKLDISNYSKGIYFIKITTEKGIKVQKLQKD